MDSGESRRSGAGLSRREALGLAAGLSLLRPGVGSAETRNTVDSRPGAAGEFTGDQLDLMAKTLAQAETQGFSHGEFMSPDLHAAVQAQDPGAAPMLRAALLEYARAQRGGRVLQADLPVEWGVRPAPYDPAPEFAAAIAQNRLPGWLDGLPPPYEGYRGLVKALARYRSIGQRHPWRAIADGPPLAQGAADPRVGALRKRLQAEDDSLGSADDPNAFDDDLARAVIRFQRRYGLVTDGVVGPPTLAALNVPVAGRVLQIEANMERWRWLPRQLPPSRIQVNIAATVMAVYQDDKPVLAMKAVAGRPGDETPMLTAEITSIVLNPAWHVPDSIAKKEIWPKVAHDRSYLAKNDYEVVHTNGETRLVQRAGPKSALGRYKFDFANPYGVYLHDTPVRSGFAHTSRLASHGCVRLEEPKALAELLLAANPDWPPDRIAETVADGKTVRVPVARPMPLFILYWTAFADPTGQVAFRTDAYDWDQKLIDLLGAEKNHA